MSGISAQKLERSSRKMEGFLGENDGSATCAGRNQEEGTV